MFTDVSHCRRCGSAVCGSAVCDSIQIPEARATRIIIVISHSWVHVENKITIGGGKISIPVCWISNVARIRFMDEIGPV